MEEDNQNIPQESRNGNSTCEATDLAKLLEEKLKHPIIDSNCQASLVSGESISGNNTNPTPNQLPSPIPLSPASGTNYIQFQEESNY